MGRRPKNRKGGYYDDAQALLRMGQAIVSDVDMPEPWRRDMDDRIKALAADLLRAPRRHVFREGASRHQGEAFDVSDSSDSGVAPGTGDEGGSGSGSGEGDKEG